MLLTLTKLEEDRRMDFGGSFSMGAVVPPKKK
jgi:hypothetical protein